MKKKKNSSPICISLAFLIHSGPRGPAQYPAPRTAYPATEKAFLPNMERELKAPSPLSGGWAPVWRLGLPSTPSPLCTPFCWPRLPIHCPGQRAAITSQGGDLHRHTGGPPGSDPPGDLTQAHEPIILGFYTPWNPLGCQPDDKNLELLLLVPSLSSQKEGTRRRQREEPDKSKKKAHLLFWSPSRISRDVNQYTPILA